MMKKLISCFLVTAMLLSMSSFASAYVEDENIVAQGETVIDAADNWVLKYITYDNGDMQFKEYHDDILTSESYVDQSEKEILVTSYATQTRSATTETITFEEASTYVSLTPASTASYASTANTAGFTRLGRVDYQWFQTNLSGHCSAYFDFSKIVGDAQELHVNGTFANIAALAGAVALVVGAAAFISGTIVASVAVSIAGNIARVFSIASTATLFIIPNYKATIYPTSVTWEISNASAPEQNTLIEGSSVYVVPHDTSESPYTTTDNYYDSNYFYSKLNSFAVKAYQQLWGNDSVNITDWLILNYI